MVDRGNSAKQGGGIYLASVLDAEPSSSDLESVNLPSVGDEPSFSFLNAVISNNTASLGGGIFLDALFSFTPTFGPECFLTENVALQFGGAMYFMEYHQPSKIIFGGEFAGK